jgi:hypothetical protein
MAGIMAAVAGNAQNIVYVNGLWNTTTGADLSPINGFAVNSNITRIWIGYIRANATASFNLGLLAQASAGDFGGSATTACRLWFGSVAVSGFNDSNLTVFAGGNQFSTANVSMTQGLYYPVRIRWDGFYEEGLFGDDSSGSIEFYINSNNNVSGLIFYNSLTNGF